MSGDSNPRGDSNTLESEISLLKRMPSGHYTEHNGVSIQVGKLIEQLREELEQPVKQEKGKTG